LQAESQPAIFFITIFHLTSEDSGLSGEKEAVIPTVGNSNQTLDIGLGHSIQDSRVPERTNSPTDRQPSATQSDTSSMGSSIQEANTPWKSGATYKQGFPSLNNEEKAWHENSQNDLATTDSSPKIHTESATKEVLTPVTILAGNVSNSEDKKDNPSPHVVTRDTAIAHSIDGVYTIQLSSFLTADKAKREVDKFLAHGLKDTWVMTAEVTGKTVYRVCVGHFKTGKEARAAQSKIAELSGLTEAFIQKIMDRVPSSL